MDNQYLLIICIAGAVALVGFFIAQLAMSKSGDGKLRDRLSAETEEAQRQQRQQDQQQASGVVPLLQKVGQAAAEPFMPKSREKQSSMRRRLAYAGVYSSVAFKVMTGCKLIFLVLGLFTGYVLGNLSPDPLMLILGLSMGGLIGYLAPVLWLRIKIKQNQQALTYGLPDGLDLMVVCVESGLTIDAAMQRVGQELALAHPALSRELGIAHMETRVGLSRSESLKNLGTRTGNAALQSLSSMLIQADRFGTSIASALRIHADSLRTNRQHAAEEMAAKASVKMSFPLVLFIFPATFIVLAGPTVIGLMNSALFQ